MRYILIAGLALVIFALIARLKKGEKKITELESKIEQLQLEKMPVEPVSESVEDSCHAIWDYANTIHLYASLTTEESASSSIKEKQQQIIRAAEEIMNLSEK